MRRVPQETPEAEDAYSDNQWDSGSAQKNRELIVIDRLHVDLLFSSLAFFCCSISVFLFLHPSV